MGDTKIQWTNKTWNPIRARNTVTGEVGWFCERVSHGCDHCYAEKMNVNTYFGNGLPYKASSLPKLELFLDEKILTAPLRWRKPQQIFVCSMTDLFGRFVKDEWIIEIFKVMAQASRHTFQVLTKRPERMRQMSHDVPGVMDWPNVWLGTSIEDQETADRRIPELLQTDAFLRWISAEPLLSPTVLNKYLSTFNCPDCVAIDWVVVGGESGGKARRSYVPNVRAVVKQCRAAGVPIFVKQLGAFVVDRNDAGFDGCEPDSWPFEIEQRDAVEYNINGYREDFQGADVRIHLLDRKGGDISEWPEDLRVREYPDAA